MKQIILSGKYGKGKVSMVDDDVYESIKQYKWQVKETGYVFRNTWYEGRTKKITLARLIMSPPAHLQVDHINRDKLDNRRENLRVVTQQENLMNRDVVTENYCGLGVKVVINKNSRKYRAYIHVKNRNIDLGTHDDINKAFEARRQAEKMYRS